MLLLMVDNANIDLRNMILRVPSSCIFVVLIILMCTSHSQRINSDAFTVFIILSIIISLILFIGKKYFLLFINISVLLFIVLNNNKRIIIQANETKRVEEINACVYIISQEKIRVNNIEYFLLRGSFVKGINEKKSFYNKDVYFFLTTFKQINLQALYNIKGKLLIQDGISPLKCYVSQIKALNYSKKAKVCVLENLELRTTTKSFLKAFLFGDKSELSKEQKRVFQESGTMHLFAVSGLHVGCLFFALSWIFKLFGLGQIKSSIFTMITLLGYLYLVNFSVSSTRAYIMLIIWLFYKWVGIRAISLNVVCLAGLSLLIMRFENFTNIGFLLSISVVLAITWLIHGIYFTTKHKFLVGFIQINLVNYAAFWGSFLILAQTFKIIIPISIFSNMLLIPIISIIMPISFITVLFLQIPILNFLTTPFEFILLFVIDICNWFSNISWSTLPWSECGESFNYNAYALNVFLILSFGGIKNVYFRIVLLPTICVPLLLLL